MTHILFDSRTKHDSIHYCEIVLCALLNTKVISVFFSFRISAVLPFTFLFAFYTIMASQSKIPEFTQGISNFASEFYKECAESKPGDVIISPLSVASALALLSQGLLFVHLFVCVHLSLSNFIVIYEQRIKAEIGVNHHGLVKR